MTTAKSEKSDAAVAAIRAALVARGSSLREWAFERSRRAGVTNEVDLQRDYATVRRTVERWAARTDTPRAGTLGALIMADLRRELSPVVIFPAAQAALAGGQPEHKRRV